jgi:hypothetical protein
VTPGTGSTGSTGAPTGCTNWFDGCNSCHRSGPTSPMMCTMMMCFRQGTPSCRAYAPGYGPSAGGPPVIAVDPMPPVIVVDPMPPAGVSGVQVGGRCAAGFCENPRDCPQCAAGLTCQTAGMMCAGTCYGTCQASGGHRRTQMNSIDPGFGVTPGTGSTGSTGAPTGCLNWFDGCNNCHRSGPTSPMMCTMMMCFRQGTPSCTAWAPGYGSNQMRPGGSTGSSAHNCCGGGSACGYVYCPAASTQSDGCVRSYMIAANGLTMSDCGVPAPPPPPTNSIGIGVQAGGRCASGFCENPRDCPTCAAGLMCDVTSMMCAGTCYGTCQASGGH